MYNDREGFKHMKAGHMEKDMSQNKCSDLRYTDKPNPEALKEAGDKLAEYVKKNKMKY